MADKDTYLRRSGAQAASNLGTVARNLPSVLIANAIMDASRASQRGAAEFAEGAFGLDPGSLVWGGSAAAPAQAAPAKAAPAQAAAPSMSPVELAAARQAWSTGYNARPATPSPQDQVLGLASAILQNPRTLSQAKAAVGMLPAPPKPQTSADALVGENASLVQQMFNLKNNEIAAAVQAGRITAEEAAAAKENASKELFERWLAIGGGDPTKAAFARLQAEQE